MECLVIFAVAAAGSFVCLAAELTVTWVAGAQRETQVASATRVASAKRVGDNAPPDDALLAFGFILICYGVGALALIAALPGPRALERTGLAFALLCAGGLVGEISTSGATPPQSTAEENEDGPVQRRPESRRLALTLMLMLDLMLAVLISGQELLEIVPPPQAARVIRAAEFDPIVVIAQRTRDPLDRSTASF